MHLPDELLIQIFLCLDSHDISQKFHISQVCSRWRTVACGEQFLWNRFSVMTPLDARRLSLVMQRSRSAALDVKLPWYYRYQQILLTDPERLSIATGLATSRLRILHLSVDFSRQKPVGLFSLLRARLDFPLLEDLEVHGAEYEPITLELSLTAPKLKRLDLYRIGARQWPLLFGPCLEELSLVNCDGAGSSLLDDIFGRCCSLRSLTLLNFPFETDFSGILSTTAGQCMPGLKSLSLRMHVRELTAVLRSGFCDLLLNQISTSTYNGFLDDETQEYLAEILRGVDPLQSLRMKDITETIIEDRAGRIRNLDVWNDDGEWQWPDVWVEFATAHGGRETMSKFRIRSCYWNTLAEAFSACTPMAEDIEIQIDLDSDDIDDPYSFEYSEPAVLESDKAAKGLRYLRCPNLHRVVFVDIGKSTHSSNGPQGDVVRRLLRAINCETSKVEVCLSGAGLADDVSGESLASFVEELGDRWILCTHCDGTA